MTDMAFYSRWANKYPVLSRDEERLCAVRARAGDTRARDKLILSNLRFVMQAARKLSGYGVPVDDLIQEGNIALMTAVDKFDPERGFRFCTYATWWVRARLSLFVMRNFFITKRFGTERERKRFYNDFATLVSEREVSLDAKMDGSQASFVTIMPSELPTPDSLVLEREMIEGVREALLAEVKNDRERRIIRKRLLCDAPATLEEIGQHDGVSRERVRQCEASLILRARRALRQVV